MKQTRLLVFVLPFFAAMAALASKPALAAAADTVTVDEQKSLDSIRVAMAQRDIPGAKDLLAKAAQNGSPDYEKQYDRLELICHSLEQFWKAVSDGTKTLRALDEFEVANTRVVVVEISPDRLVIRVLGENKRYTLDNLPPKVAIALASRAMAEDKRNFVFVAAFHLADKAGDKAEAARLLTKAKRAGIEVGTLADELAVAAPAAANIKIPEMNQTMAALLSPDRWIELTGTGTSIERSSLAGAKQGPNGHLAITAAAQPRVIAFQTRLDGNLGCRIALQCEDELTFGMFSGTDPQQANMVNVRAGLNVVEVARQRGAWHGRLNGQPMEVESTDITTARMSGHIGFLLPANCECTIAAFEIRTR